MARKANHNLKPKGNSASLSQSRNENKVPASIMGPRLILLLSVFVLAMIGLVMVYSSSSIVALGEGQSAESYFFKQLGFALVGIIGCVTLWKFVPYYVWTRRLLVWIVWALSIVLLIATAIWGTEEGGAKRWLSIELIGIGIQAAEFAKIAFLLMAAHILLAFRNGATTLRVLFMQILFLILAPLLFLFQAQSDLGTTVICFFGILALMWFGEVPLRVVLGTLVAGILFAILAVLVSEDGYRGDRFLYLDPWNDGEGGLAGGYQIIHSYYAIAEGGLFGVGLGNSREKFQYLKAAETDFIFAVFSEEFGMVGALTVILLFLLVLYAGFRIARSAPDIFATVLAGSFTSILVFQAFLNIGCVIGMFPTTGKPLPFISQGGSSLIASFLMVGIILSVSRASGMPSIYEQRRNDLRVVRAQDPFLTGTKTTRHSGRDRLSSNAAASKGRSSQSDTLGRGSRSGRRR